MALVFVTIGWLIGVWTASRLGLPLSIWGATAVFLSIITLASTTFHNKRILILFASLTAFALGGARYVFAQPAITPAHVAYYNDSDAPIAITGLIVGEPDVRDRSVNLQLRAETAVFADGHTSPVTGDILLQTDRFPVIEYGTRLTAVGQLETPPEFEDFSYKAYLARQQMHSIMRRAQIEVLETGQGSPFYHAIYAFKAKAQTAINQILSDPQAGLLSAILLGNRHNLPADVVEEFRVAGISHIIAISGLHVAVLIGVLVAVTKPFLSRRAALPFILVILGMYTIMVGASPSVMRAAIMGSIYLLAAGFRGRHIYAPAVLMAAAFIITLINPLLLWDVGFQLTFAAVMGLLLYAQPMMRWGRARVENGRLGNSSFHPFINSFIIDPIAVTVAIQILTIPLVIFYFGRWSLVSIPANLLTLPALPPTIVLGGLATLIQMAIPALGQLFGWLVWIFLSWMLTVARFFAAVPGASLYMEINNSGVLLIYSAIGLLTWWYKTEREKRKQMRGAMGRDWMAKTAVFVTLILVILTVQWAKTQPDGLLHVNFLNVGQGDAIFIQTPSGRQILVDGGLYPTVLNDHIGRQLPFGDRSIDIIIATHPDADHISGLPALFERYDVDLLLTNGSDDDSPIQAALSDAAIDTQIHIARVGETIRIDDGVQLEILHPTTVGADDDRNNESVSLRLVYGDFSLLLTGDAEVEAEREMLESKRPLTSVVYKAGHHGSNTSSSAPFLAAVKPQIAIVSAGADNSYGHPHVDVLERLAAGKTAVLRTDELGTIEVITDGKGIWLWAGR